jgi:hypothetical protein
MEHHGGESVDALRLKLKAVDEFLSDSEGRLRHLKVETTKARLRTLLPGGLDPVDRVYDILEEV